MDSLLLGGARGSDGIGPDLNKFLLGLFCWVGHNPNSGQKWAQQKQLIVWISTCLLVSAFMPRVMKTPFCSFSLCCSYFRQQKGGGGDSEEGFDAATVCDEDDGDGDQLLPEDIVEQRPCLRLLVVLAW
ncbi:hypothetical protein AAC387_Pa08g1035 [Persea americana]